MKIKGKIWLLFLLATIAYENAAAQFPVNIYNGLPSNHVYKTVKDRLGYLWIATPKGLIKYNGYQCKTVYHGDVWGLYEDKKGRMWLSHFNNDIGYIYHDSYKKVYNPNKGIIYHPENFVDYAGGMFFTSAYGKYYLCYERNDTVSVLDVHKYLKKLQPDIPISDSIRATIYFLENGEIAVLLFPFSIYHISFVKGRPKIRLTCSLNEGYAFGHVNGIRFGRYRDMYLESNTRSTAIHTTSMINCQQRTISLSNDSSEYFYVAGEYDSSRLFCATNKKVYILNYELQIEHIYSARQLLNNDSLDNTQITFLYKDDFWGNCISSMQKGITVDIKTNYFKRAELANMAHYTYLGRSVLGINHLWNEFEKKMIFMNNDKYQLHVLPFLRNPQKIIPYDSSRSLILSYDYIYSQNNSGAITDAFKGKSIYNITPDGHFLFDKLGGFRDIYVAKDKSIYMLSRTHGLSHLSFYRDTVVNSLIDNSRYNGIAYDNKHNRLFAYNNKNILAYDCGLHKSYPPDHFLNTLKIQGVEKLLIDSIYGNILIKDVNDLLACNITNRTCFKLFPNVVLNNSHLIIHGNTLILAGEFGVLFSKIIGAGKFSPPVIYRNIKNMNYYYVNDLYVADNNVFVNTDRGLYTVDLPVENKFHEVADTISYKFIATYNDTAVSIKNGDTLFINNNNTNVKFDIINPLGVGTLRFLYNANEPTSETQMLNANEINFSNIIPGTFHSVSLFATDDVWKSNKLNLTIYVIPQWWQTPYGKRILWLLGLLVTLLVISITVLATRRSIIRKNAKKNKLLELELKSIYAQINPHFIFNTINSGLLFIKKKDTDEAYRHLFKFSKLLRSYLKSARTRYISLAEEISNLRDYIELQQSRFEGVFTYAIKTSNINDATNIYIPSLLLQPIVENAINHGLLPKENDGHLDIEFAMNNNQLVCRIEDNGLGYRKPGNIENKELKKESYGNELVKELVNIFNEYEKINIRIEYIEKKTPLTGIIAMIYINYHDGKV